MLLTLAPPNLKTFIVKHIYAATNIMW